MTRKRVLSGMRPTGRLHMGHLFGALDNWRKLQETYDCFFFIADWHALTTDYADPSKVKEFTTEVVLDWLAAGLDPKKAIFFGVLAAGADLRRAGRAPDPAKISR